VCVVGAGKMGTDHVERLAGRIVGAEVSVVVDADFSRAKKAIEAVRSAVAVSDLGRALDRENVDAVVIATPGFLHREMLLQARERDLPIFARNPSRRTRHPLGILCRRSSNLERNASRLASGMAMPRRLVVKLVWLRKRAANGSRFP
jgi:hypothetical protein